MNKSGFGFLLVVSLASMACGGGDDGGGQGPLGPPGGMVEVDGSAIGTGATGGSGTGGFGALGGFGGATGGFGGATGGFGGSGGGAQCVGSATPCGLLPTSQCWLALGCTKMGTCSGSASSCYSQYSSYSCSSQKGCYWSSYDDSCSGSAWSCSLFSYSAACTGQKYCSWDETCEGTPMACSKLPDALCDDQPGCQLVYP